jgi:hypothetical protein
VSVSHLRRSPFSPWSWLLSPSRPRSRERLPLARRPRRTRTSRGYSRRTRKPTSSKSRRTLLRPRAASSSGKTWSPVGSSMRTIRRAGRLPQPSLPARIGGTSRATTETLSSRPSAPRVPSRWRLRYVLGRCGIRRMSWMFSPDTLDFTVRWVTNARNVVVEARVFRGRRQVGRVRDSNETIISLDEDSGFLSWRRSRRVKTGTRLRVLVSVRGGGRTATVRRFVRAP